MTAFPSQEILFFWSPLIPLLSALSFMVWFGPAKVQSERGLTDDDECIYRIYMLTSSYTGIYLRSAYLNADRLYVITQIHRYCMTLYVSILDSRHFFCGKVRFEHQIGPFQCAIECFQLHLMFHYSTQPDKVSLFCASQLPTSSSLTWEFGLFKCKCPRMRSTSKLPYQGGSQTVPAPKSIQMVSGWGPSAAHVCCKTPHLSLCANK